MATSKLSQKLLAPFYVGMQHASTLLEEKRIFLVNAACILWIQGFLVLILLGFLFEPRLLGDYSVVVFAAHTLLLAFTMGLQMKGFLTAARVILILSAYGDFMMFDFVVLTEYSVEFYYIIPVLLTQILFRDFWAHLVVLGVSILLFFDLFLLRPTHEVHYESLHFVNYFLALFFIVNLLLRTNRQKEEALEKQKQELEELNRFQSKFFVNISHELRTPLTLIDGTAARLTKAEAHQQKSLIQNLVKQSGKMKQIVDDVLDVSKIKSSRLELKIRHVDLNALLGRVYQAFQTNFEEKGVKLELDSELESCILLGDGLYLERAINNIVLNSLKYTQEGTVRMHLSSIRPDEIKLEIRDTGIGIAEQELENVFKHFYQGDNDINRSGGSGIGLSFAHHIVEQHHGKTEIESEVGVGTVIRLILPIEQMEAKVQELEEVEPVPKYEAEQPLAATVLLVDDHTEMREYIGSLLEGVRILEAGNGAEGLEVLKRNMVDYVITDYMMPVMDGYEFLKTMKAERINIPVLMVTARVDMEGKLDVLRLGVDDYLTKPFHQEELVIRMNNALRNYRAREVFVKEEEVEEPEVEHPFLGSLREYVERRISDANLNVDELSEQFAMSTSSLFRKVKSLTGMSTKDFLREVKLQKAKELVDLKEVESLKELSHAVGFAKPSYFSQLYQKRFGRHPFQ